VTCSLIVSLIRSEPLFYGPQKCRPFGQHRELRESTCSLRTCRPEVLWPQSFYAKVAFTPLQRTYICSPLSQFDAHFGLSDLRGASFKSEPQAGTFGIKQPFGTAVYIQRPAKRHGVQICPSKSKARSLRSSHANELFSTQVGTRIRVRTFPRERYSDCSASFKAIRLWQTVESMRSLRCLESSVKRQVKL
jgi:hypothetical protein